MNEELFTRFFMADLPSVDLFIASVKIDGGEDDFVYPLLDQLKIRQVEIRGIIRDANAKSSDLSFKTFLNSLLIELHQASEFYNKVNSSTDLTQYQKETIPNLINFNQKIAAHLDKYYSISFPELFLKARLHRIDGGSTIFTSETYFPPFEKYIRTHIVEEYADLSYFYQRMLNERMIHRVPHLQFAQWLHDMNYITLSALQKIVEERGFRSFAKSTTPTRENNFNILFGI